MSPVDLDKARRLFEARPQDSLAAAMWEEDARRMLMVLAARVEELEKAAARPALSVMAEKARARSEDYEWLSARDQWEEDKRLGILDWDGT